MGKTMRANLCLLLLACFGYLGTLAYQIPNVQLQPLPNGFRVFIPDEPGVENVAFNINRNRPFKAFEQGEYTAHISQPINNRWSYEVKRALTDDDVLYVWTNVQHNRQVYRNMATAIAAGATQQPGGGSGDGGGDGGGVDSKDRTKEPPINNAPSSGNASCLPSKTILQNRRVCKDELIFEDNFDGHLNSSRWRHEVRLPLEVSDAEFVLYDTNAVVENGLLTITPVLWNDDRPGTNIKQGRLDLGTRCTSIQNRAVECQRQPFGAVVLPPIVSARINTKHSFSFKYGRVEIRAKLPQGDWLFPLLLLEPLLNRYGQDPYISGEMRIAFIRSNIELLTRNDQSIDGSTLYGGAVLTPETGLRESSMAKIQRSVHFGEDFHVYSLTWDERQLSLAVDGHNYGTVKGGFSSVYANDLTRSNAWKGGEFMAPLDQEFFITLGVSAGGHGDFPDECVNKPWINTSPKAEYSFWRDRSNWKTTWISPALQVDYVRVYAI